MNSGEFLKIRRYLGKSQSQIARLLGISLRAVQSFEQGWRSIAAPTERQMLFLLYMKIAPKTATQPCWQVKGCDLKMRRKCPAWEFKAGYICWFINGTICGGMPQHSWKKKMELCRECKVFKILRLPTEA